MALCFEYYGSAVSHRHAQIRNHHIPQCPTGYQQHQQHHITGFAGSESSQETQYIVILRLIFNTLSNTTPRTCILQPATPLKRFTVPSFKLTRSKHRSQCQTASTQPLTPQTSTLQTRLNIIYLKPRLNHSAVY